MKKIAIICVILGGITVFFFGWVQLMVPAGSYGVMRSKTHGLDPHIIRNGEFRWIWYKLIPANVAIQIFTLDKVSRPFTTKDTLPSGSEYASFAGFTIDFSYNVSAAFSFNIKPGALIALLEEQAITDQARLEVFETDLADQIEGFVRQCFRRYMEEEPKIEELLRSGSIAQLDQDVAERFSDIENFSYFIYTSHFPDFTLYYRFRDIYNDYIGRIQEYIQTEKLLQAEMQVASHIRLDELAKYGELLTKYPILLQYLSIEKGLR